MYVCLVIQLCLILCNPVDCSPLDFSVHGIFQERLLEWVAIAFSRGSSQHRIFLGLPDPEIKPGSPVMQADSLPSEPLGAPCVFLIFIF